MMRQRSAATGPICKALRAALHSAFIAIGRLQRPEKRFVSAPAPDRLVVDRLADLNGAGRTNRTRCLMKSQAPGIPLQPAMPNNAPRLAFQIGNDVLVLDFEQSPNDRQIGSQVLGEWRRGLRINSSYKPRNTFSASNNAFGSNMPW